MPTRWREHQVQSLVAGFGFCLKPRKEAGVAGVDIQSMTETASERGETVAPQTGGNGRMETIRMRMGDTDSAPSQLCDLGKMTVFQFPHPKYGDSHNIPSVIWVIRVNTGKMFRLVPGTEVKKH